MRRVLWVTLYAGAMALVEAAVVVYLRELFPAPDLLAAPSGALQSPFLGVEVAREAATLVMLVAVAALAAKDAWRRFLYFALAFGVWDVLYYAWLWVFMRWPPSLLTWDVLFLIPVPWFGPVLAPVLVSVGLIAGAAWLLAINPESETPRPAPAWAWALCVVGAGLILASFMLDSSVIVATGSPPSFRWWLFLGGLALGMVALIGTARRL